MVLVSGFSSDRLLYVCVVVVGMFVMWLLDWGVFVVYCVVLLYLVVLCLFFVLVVGLLYVLCCWLVLVVCDVIVVCVCCDNLCGLVFLVLCFVVICVFLVRV